MFADDDDILIGRGLLAGICPRVAALKARAVGVVSDETVAAEYGEAVTASLEQAGLRTTLIAVAPGEGSKSYAGFAQVCDGLIAHRIELSRVDSGVDESALAVLQVSGFEAGQSGDLNARMVAGLRAKGVHVRDRSKEHGCAGCVRITVGPVEHTRTAIAALEELCAKR